MNRRLTLGMLVVGCLATGRGYADSCRPAQSAVIDAETQCVSGGINIGYMGDGGSKVACLQSAEVQRICGPDGRVTRLHAYTIWYNRLKEFEGACAKKGGVFTFQDPQFVEPTDESFCLAAQPEVGSNMFEEPLCNYRSICPAVTVSCDFSCGRKKIAELPAAVTQTANSSPFFR